METGADLLIKIFGGMIFVIVMGILFGLIDMLKGGGGEGK